MQTIPTCYFPTKIVFVDDNYTYLSSIERMLKREDHSFTFHTHADLALSLINDTSVEAQIANYFYEVLGSDLRDSKTIEYKMRDVCDLIYNRNRFDIHSVVFVDYDMPAMNGIEFCQQITNKHIQKVLLTGVADEQVIIEAFNKGLIDGYIKKHDSDLVGKIKSFINEFTLRFFNELTHKKEAQAIDVKYAATDIPEFKTAFNDIVKDNNIIEFYQLDPIGCFLMIDANGAINTLYVSNDVKNNELLKEIESYHDETLATTIKDQILKQGKVFCFHSNEALVDARNFPKLDEIQEHLCSAKVIRAEPNYYYTLQKGKYSINNSCFFPFKLYKNNIIQQVI